MSDNPLSGLEKVALLMKSLPAEVVDKVLRHMDPVKGERVKSAVAEVSKRTDLTGSLTQVLDEAEVILKGGKKEPDEKTSHVDIRVGNSAPLPAPAPKQQLTPDADPFAALAGLGAEILTPALENENARTVSIVMDRLEVTVAGQIYKRLSPEKRKEVSLRFTETNAVNEDLLQRIAQALYRKCQTQRETAPQGASEENAREKRMADLLRNLDRNERMEMLGVLENSDKNLAARLKEMLYQFEDILRMVNTSIQKLLTEVDMRTLAVALKGAAPDLHSKITSNLSKRAQETLKEEIDLTGNVTSAKVREARKAMEEALQRLDQRDELAMAEES
jgi:flagellar motor switch protein FliG